MMARLDRKQGRFDPTYESVEIESALAGHQSVYGQTISYFRFSHELTQTHDVYGEAAGSGRVFYEPVDIPVLQVIREEGAGEQEDGGLYWTDTIHVTASFKQLINAGLDRLDVEHNRRLRDRFVYDGRVFRITGIHVLGQLKKRDVMVGIDAVQMKREDLLDDPQFSAWWGSETAYRPVDGQPYVPGPNYGGGNAPHTHAEYALATHNHDDRYAPLVHTHQAGDVGAYTKAQTDAKVASGVGEAKAYTNATAAPKVHTHADYLTSDDLDTAVSIVLQPVVVTFASPSTVWEATYNFPRRPDITTTTLDGRKIVGEESYVHPNIVRVSWAVPVAGVLELR